MTTTTTAPSLSLCGRPHREDQIETRWEQIEALIEATPEDEQAAQWSVIGSCRCCCGPLKLSQRVQDNPFTAPDEDFDCSRCGGAK